MLNRLLKAAQGMPESAAPEVTVEQFVANDTAATAQVVDVREPDEWNEGRMPTAVLIPLGELAARHGELDLARPVVTVCHSGRRSLTAADILLDAGFKDVHSLAGGMVAWAGAGQPVER